MTLTEPTTVATFAPPKFEAQMISIVDIARSPYNARKLFAPGPMAELTESIRKHGVAQPLLVRPNPERKGPLAIRPFELIAGERRLRAARDAGLKEVPCVIRDLSNDQLLEVLELQLVENLHRSDLHPLEEAQAFEQCRAANISAEELAKRVGKHRSYVFRSLQLLKLIPAAQESFLRGEMLQKHASQIARLPEAEQPKALLFTLGAGWDEAVKGTGAVKAGQRGNSPAELKRFIDQRIMRRLKDAQFSKVDAKLVPEAGACNACPKRTGANALLFEEADPKDDRCLDGACYERKFEAHLVQLETRAAAKGETFLRLKWDQRGRTWTEVFGDKCASESRGVVTEGWERGTIKRICADKECKKHWARSSSTPTRGASSKSAEKEEAKLEVERVYRLRLWKEVSRELKNPDIEDLRTVALLLWEMEEFQDEYMAARGLERPKKSMSARAAAKPVETLLGAMKTSKDLLAWIASIALFRDTDVMPWDRKTTADALHRAAARHGLRPEQVRKEVEAELAEKRDKAKATGKAVAPKSASARSGRK